MGHLVEKRVVVYATDIAIVTGRSERYGRNIIKKIKERLNKKSHQLVTVSEFADYMGIEEKEVREAIF